MPVYWSGQGNKVCWMVAHWSKLFLPFFWEWKWLSLKTFADNNKFNFQIKIMTKYVSCICHTLSSSVTPIVNWCRTANRVTIILRIFSVELLENRSAWSQSRTKDLRCLCHLCLFGLWNIWIMKTPKKLQMKYFSSYLLKLLEPNHTKNINKPSKPGNNCGRAKIIS